MIELNIPLLLLAESLICLTEWSQISLLTATARLLPNVSPVTVPFTNMFSMHDLVCTSCKYSLVCVYVKGQVRSGLSREHPWPTTLSIVLGQLLYKHTVQAGITCCYTVWYHLAEQKDRFLLSSVNGSCKAGWLLVCHYVHTGLM